MESGKPFQSKLKPHADEIFEWLEVQKKSFREVAALLMDRHGLAVSHNAVHSFAKRRRGRRAKLFYEGLPPFAREKLLRKIAAEWTHNSTALEGNTLTLGDTIKVLELGLTISGKPLREHLEVHGHARAIDLVYRMLEKPVIDEQDVFDLHRAVMPPVMDIHNPIGAWKREPNGTHGEANGRSVFMEYAAPGDVPALMSRWISEFNKAVNRARGAEGVLDAYARAHAGFARIHPFYDGNGRVARLVANIPVLRAGWPPILVSPRRRGAYISLLWRYQNAVGRIAFGAPLVPRHAALGEFKEFLRGEWNPTLRLVEKARESVS